MARLPKHARTWEPECPLRRPMPVVLAGGGLQFLQSAPRRWTPRFFPHSSFPDSATCRFNGPWLCSAYSKYCSSILNAATSIPAAGQRGPLPSPSWWRPISGRDPRCGRTTATGWRPVAAPHVATVPPGSGGRCHRHSRDYLIRLGGYAPILIQCPQLPLLPTSAPLYSL